jgi:hypothetical protein
VLTQRSPFVVLSLPASRAVVSRITLTSRTTCTMPGLRCIRSMALLSATGFGAGSATAEVVEKHAKIGATKVDYKVILPDRCYRWPLGPGLAVEVRFIGADLRQGDAC